MTAEPAEPAVAIDGLSKRYGERLALDDVSLQVAPGQLRGLLGPNGAGKTTVLRILMRLIRPDAGRVTLLGRPLGGADTVPDRGVAGFVEEPAFYPYLSGTANLELLAELDDGSGPSVAEVLARVGLKGPRPGPRLGLLDRDAPAPGDRRRAAALAAGAAAR